MATVRLAIPAIFGNGPAYTAEFDPAVAIPSVLSQFRPSRRIDGTHWKLTSDLVLWTGREIVGIPRGFAWDGSSRPWFAGWYIGRDEHLAASCPHDWGYWYHGFWVCDGDKWVWKEASKRYVDRLFQDILLHVYKERRGKSWAMWFGVNTGGYWSWGWGTCDWRCSLHKPCQLAEWHGCPMKRLSTRPPQTVGKLT